MDVVNYNDYIRVEGSLSNTRDLQGIDDALSYFHYSPEFTTCKYCNGNLIVKKSDIDYTLHGRILYFCKKCGWWYVMQVIEEYDFNEDELIFTDGVEITQVHAVLKRFDASSLDVPMEVLKSELSKREEILYKIHPTKMERLVQDVLGDFFSCEVEHIGRSGDGGIDLVMITGDKPIAVQVKRRTRTEHIEQVNEIREFVGALMLGQKLNGLFITTGAEFSSGCYSSADLAKNLGLVDNLMLYNRDRFLSLFRQVNTVNNPWDRFFR